MVGGFLILIVIVFAPENNVQTDVPVANVDITFVCLDPLAGFATNSRCWVGVASQNILVTYQGRYPAWISSPYP